MDLKTIYKINTRRLNKIGISKSDQKSINLLRDLPLDRYINVSIVVELFKEFDTIYSKSYKNINRYDFVNIQVVDKYDIYLNISELDYIEDLYINLYNTRLIKSVNVDVDIKPKKSTQKNINKSYRDKVLDVSRHYRLLGLDPKSVRVKVDDFKKEYWSN